MRKNNNVIKALAVGLSAAMLLNPMAALADELPVEPADNDNDGKNIEVESEKETTVADAAATLAETAKDTHDLYGSGSNHDIQVPFTPIVAKADLGSVDNVIRDTDALLATGSDKDIKAAEGELAVGVHDTEGIVKTEEAKIGGELFAMQGFEVAYDTTDNLANTAANNGNKAVSDGDAAADTAEKIAEDVSANMAEYQEKIDTDKEIIKNATTIAEANAAYEDISANVAAADVSANAAEEAFGDAKNAYDKALEDYNNAAKAYEKAMADNKKAAELLNKHADDVSANAEKIDTVVGDTEEDIEALEEAVIAAQKDFVKTGMGLIMTLEEKAASEKSPSWGNTLDPLFKAIVQYYYIPEVEGGELVSTKWVKNKDDDTKNYCVVTYTVNGQTITKNLNYRIEEGNKSGGLVIFEKKVAYDVDGTVIVEEDFANGNAISLENGKVVVSDGNGKVYATGESQGTETKVEEVKTDSKVVSINNNTESVSYSVEDGVVKKTVTAEVTTTTYTTEKSNDKTVVAEKKFKTEDEARTAALNEIKDILKKLGDNQSVVINGKTLTNKDVEKVDGTLLEGVSVVEKEGKTTVQAKYVVTYTDVDAHSAWWGYSESDVYNGLQDRDANEYLVSDAKWVGADYYLNDYYAADYVHYEQAVVSVDKDSITVEEEAIKANVTVDEEVVKAKVSIDTDKLSKDVAATITVSEDEIKYTEVKAKEIKSSDYNLTQQEKNAIRWNNPQRQGEKKRDYDKRISDLEKQAKDTKKANLEKQAADAAAQENAEAKRMAEEAVWKQKYEAAYSAAYNDAYNDEYQKQYEAEKANATAKAIAEAKESAYKKALEEKAKTQAADADAKFLALAKNENDEYVVLYAPYQYVDVNNVGKGEIKNAQEGKKADELVRKAQAAVAGVKIAADSDKDRQPNIGRAQYVDYVITQAAEYGFSNLTYYINTVNENVVKENKVISVTTYAAEEVNSYLTNENFNNGNILLSEYNSDNQRNKDYDYINDKGEKVLLKGDDAAVTRDFRAELAKAEAKAQKYNKLLSDIDKAELDIDELQDDIAQLKAQIAAIKKAGSEAKLADFTAKLEKAQATLDASLKVRDSLKQQLEEVQEDLDETIRRLTPAPSNDNEPEVTPTEEIVAIPTIAAAPARNRTVTPATPVVEEPVEVAEEVEATVEEVVIAEEETALAATPETEEKAEAATVAIEDEIAPLAPEAEQNMSWWWVLIVLALGTTGAELYRRHQLKKKAAAVEVDEK